MIRKENKFKEKAQAKTQIHRWRRSTVHTMHGDKNKLTRKEKGSSIEAAEKEIEESDSKEKREEAKSEKESEDPSSSSTEKKTLHETYEEKDVTFVVLQKNVRSSNSSDRIEELTREVEGCNWDAFFVK